MEYFCLNEYCTEKPLFCLICYKQHHLECKEELIVYQNELKERVCLDDSVKEYQSKKEEQAKKLDDVCEVVFYQHYLQMKEFKQLFFKKYKQDYTIDVEDIESNIWNLKNHFFFQF